MVDAGDVELLNAGTVIFQYSPLHIQAGASFFKRIEPPIKTASNKLAFQIDLWRIHKTGFIKLPKQGLGHTPTPGVFPAAFIGLLFYTQAFLVLGHPFRFFAPDLAFCFFNRGSHCLFLFPERSKFITQAFRGGNATFIMKNATIIHKPLQTCYRMFQLRLDTGNILCKRIFFTLQRFHAGR